MEFHYISPSVLPSRSANSVHVVRQCEGLVKSGVDLTLYAKRSVADKSLLNDTLLDAYGVDLSVCNLVTYYSHFSLAENLCIASIAATKLVKRTWPLAVMSRNLYASYILGVLRRRPLLFETHYLEQGRRKQLQKAIMTCPWVTTVVISEQLDLFLSKHHGVKPSNVLVLHDAAPDGIQPVSSGERRAELERLVVSVGGNWQAVCGYFGHLYPGRGIEIIESMAAARPNVLFIVFGGNQSDVNARIESNSYNNLRFLGHVPHEFAQSAMRVMDVLLMPYQDVVSLGVKGVDTARWMSPMKMFEYLASGVPVISSDLLVLREVLKDGENALLVPASDSAAWVNALDKLIKNSELSERIGGRGHEDYRNYYTWSKRATSILKAMSELNKM